MLIELVLMFAACAAAARGSFENTGILNENNRGLRRHQPRQEHLSSRNLRNRFYLS